MLERHFIYFPERRLAATPADLGLEFEDLRFQAPDGTGLHAWLVPGEGDHALLLLHGNAGNIGHRVPLLAALHRELRLPIVILDYRGYGASEGTPSEAGLYLDAEAALDLLTQRLELRAEQVVLFGQSLGAAVALELANRRPALGVILESSLTSVADMARRYYPWLPVGPLLRTRYDALSKISSLSAPVLIIHGQDDTITPPEMGERLFAAAPEPKQLLMIPGAGHNDAHVAGAREYFGGLRSFLAGFGTSPSAGT